MGLRLPHSCTVHDGFGARCGQFRQCIRVQTLNGKGEILHDHWVCSAHRAQMKLPEFDVVITPTGELRRLHG